MRMRDLFRMAFIACAAASQLLTGCGGGINASNIRKYARPKDPDELEAPSPAPTARANSSGNSASENVAAKGAPSSANVAAGEQVVLTPTSAADGNPATPGARDPRLPPLETLSPEEQRARTIGQLQRVAAALQAYLKRNKNTLPPAALSDKQYRPLLSWRVALLPWLGHRELYEQFHLTEPWDSPHNQALLAQIPPEFQSPLRQDEQTCLLAVAGNGYAFAGARGVPLSHFEDSPDATLAIVEVTPDAAIPWTKPEEFSPGVDDTILGGVRDDGFYAISATGRPKFAPQPISPRNLLALFTSSGLDGSPQVVETLVPLEKSAERPETLLPSENQLAAGNGGELPPDSEGSPATMPGSERGASGTLLAEIEMLVHLSGAAGHRAQFRVPPPAEAEQAAAKATLRPIYQLEISSAKTPSAWQTLARKLMQDAERVNQEAATLFVLLQAARDLAIKAGDYQTTLEIVDRIIDRFEVDAEPLRIKSLEQVAAMAPRGEQIALLEPVVRSAIERHEFDFALKAQSLLMESARRQGDRTAIVRSSQLRAAIEGAQAEYKGVPAAMAKLKSDAENSAANLTVGRYLCFVLERWNEGLPLLARSRDIRMRGIAGLELEPTKSSQVMIDLADQWWELALKARLPVNRSQLLRAVHWYRQVLAANVQGVERLRAEKRLQEASSLLGSDVITQSGPPGEQLPPGKNAPSDNAG